MEKKAKTSPSLVTTTIARAVTAMFAGTKLHAKQIESITHAIIGAMAAPQAGVAALGRSAAAIRCKEAKHGIKQVVVGHQDPPKSDRRVVAKGCLPAKLATAAKPG